MKNTQLKFLLALIVANFIALLQVNAQCTIRGKITDSNGEVPIGVAIYLKADNTVGAITDINGEYSLKVANNGSHIFVVSYVGYKKIEDTIKCTKGAIIIKNYELQPIATSLSAVTITGRAQNSFDAHMETKKKLSSNTIDFISAETIKKTVDANVASAISRVTGVSSTSSGLITVRGTGDRYLKTTINGSRIPTLDPFTNNIKLDIFPASLVDNIVVAKTASPDLPGDWAGAYISVETKQYPENLAVNIETSFGYNQQTTFKDVITSQKSTTDWLGYDNNFRDRDHSDYVQFNAKPSTYEEFTALGLGDYFKNLGVTSSTPWNDYYFKLGLVELGLLGKAQIDDPDAFNAAKAKYNTLYYREHAYSVLNADAVKSEKTFANNWATTSGKAPFNFSQSFSIGNQTKLFGKTLGYLMGFRYSSAVQYDPTAIGNRYGASSSTDTVTNKPGGYDILHQQTSKETRGWSALFGAAVKLNANNTISLLFMPNVTGVNNVRSVTKTKQNPNDSLFVQKDTYQQYESRSQMIYQLKTDHYFPASKLKIEFNTSYTAGKSILPDLKDTPYTSTDPVQNTPVYSRPLDGDRDIGIGRYYRYLDENVFDSRLSAELPISNSAEFVRKIKVGVAFQHNDRQQDNYYYQLMEGNGNEYISAANPSAYAYGPDRFDIVAIANHGLTGDHGDSLNSVQQFYDRILYPNNRMFGRSYVRSSFAMLDYSLTRAIRLSGGARIEQAYMHTDCNMFDDLNLASDDARRNFVAPSPINDITIRPGELKEVNVLPSASLILKLKQDEVAPINFRLNYSKTVARPSLRELSDNAYYDYELNKIVYGNSQLKTVTIDNYDLRLESYFPSGDNVSVSLFYKEFRNHIEVADFGYYLIWLNNPNTSWAKGIEIETKYNLIKSLEFRANITLVNSRSAFNTSYTKADGALVAGRSIDRTMLNQAPYVINGMLSYNLDKIGFTASISYNRQGARVISTGSYKDIPDVYELPRNLVDLKFMKKLGKHYNVSLKIMDVLNTEIVRAYKIGDNYDLYFDKYKYGTNYVFAIAYKL